MENQAGIPGSCRPEDHKFFDHFSNPFWDCDGRFSLILSILNIVHYFAWIQIIRLFWAMFMSTYVRARRWERHDILLELLDTPKDKRSDKIIELCFSYVRRPQFQTDELLRHIVEKLLLGEKSADDPIIRVMKKAENEPKRGYQKPDLWKSFVDSIKMR